MATIRDRYILEIDTTGGVRNMGAAAEASGRLSTSLRGIGTVAGVAATALAGIGLGNFIGNVADATAEFQDLRTTLETVTGSATAASEAFAFIQEFATTTPFDVQNLTEAYIRLQNAGIEPTRELLNTLGDAAAISSDKVGALEAVTQLFSRSVQGGLGLEDLDRLADRGINVYGILREELGLTRQSISEFGQTAEGAAEIQEALLRGFEREYGGGMAAAADNLSTSLSNLGIAANNSLVAVGEGGLADGLQYASEAMSNLLSSNSELAGSLGEVLGSAIIELTDLVTAMVEAFQTPGPEMELLQTIFNSVVETIGTFIDAATQIATALEPLTDVVFPALGEGIEFAASVIQTLVTGFADFVTGISEAIQNANSFGEAVTGAFTAIKDTVVDTVTGLVDAVINLFQGLYDALWGNSIIKDLIDGIITGFTELGPDLISVVDGVVQSVIDAFNKLFGAIVEGIGGAVEAGLQKVSDAYQAFKDRFFGDSEDIEDAAETTKTALEEALTADGLTAEAVLAASEQVAALAANLNSVAPEIDAHTEDLTALADIYTTNHEELETLNEFMEEYIELIGDLNDEKETLVDLSQDYLDIYKELVPLLESSNTFYEEILPKTVTLNENLATLTETMDTNIESIDLLTESLEANIPLVEEAAESIELLIEELESATDAVDDYIDGLDTMYDITRDNITVTDNLTQSLRRMADQARAAQSAAESATRALNDQAAAAERARSFQNTSNRPNSSSTSGGGSMLDWFAGFFASGGYIPSGQFGLVGERGPELISGPAQITPLDAVGSGANTNITYHISAVDALSFKQLVAKDPGFIHAMAQRGANNLAGGRR